MKKLLTAIISLFSITCLADSPVLMDSNGNLWSASGGTNYVNVNQFAANARTNHIIVKALADFPAPSAGIIQLAANTTYEINGYIPLSTNRIFMGANCLLIGKNRSTDVLNYTGTNAMLNGSNSFFNIQILCLEATSGTLLDFSNTNSDSFVYYEIKATDSIGGIGTISGFQNIMIYDCLYGEMNSGLLIESSTHENLVIDRNIFQSHGSTNLTFIDIGTSIWESVVISDNVFHFDTNASVTCISGMITNGNLNSDGVGLVYGNTFHPLGGPIDHTNYISGLSHADIRWKWSANQGLADSDITGGMITTNIQTVTILTSSVPVIVSLYWKGNEVNERFVFSADRLTYTGLGSAKIKISATANLAPSVGQNIDVALYAAINGVVIEDSESTANADSGTPQRNTMLYPLTMRTGDYFQLYVENEQSTANIVVETGVQVLVLD